MKVRHEGGPRLGIVRSKLARSIVFLAAVVVLATSLGAEPPSPTWISPEVDVSRLLAEDAANRGRKDVPLRIGFAMSTDLTPANSGVWEEGPDGGRVWTLRVVTEDALWVVLGFDVFRLQPGASLSVYDPDRATVMGPFTHADVRRHGELWFPPIAGDTLIVELAWPEELRDEDPALHLGTVSHGYKPFGVVGREIEEGTDGLDDSGACNIDINCPLGDDWQDEKRGVVILLSGGTSFCTGSLINTTANDCRPYVLTANHCSPGPSTSFGFNFEKSGCGGGTAPSPTNETVTGATLLAGFFDSDFSLLEMDAPPPESFGAYFNGWSREPQPATESIGIHHPSGDAKKISRNADTLVDGVNWGADHWRVTEWEEGTTEGGSSGSPLFDQDHHIVGQLHGGQASCFNIVWDEYGKIEASWSGGGTTSSRLSDWLDPETTGALFQDGIDHSACLFQAAGSVSLTADVYACSDTATITLRDDHLQGNATQDVAVWADGTPEIVSLAADFPGAGMFTGTIDLGLLPVVHADTVTVEYVDADDGAGGANIATQDTASVDCLAPVISNVQSGNVTGSSAEITWDTDELADSTVAHGLSPPGTSVVSSPSFVNAHVVKLSDLEECSVHYFSVSSSDPVGNLASDDNLGSHYTFETGRDVEPQFDSADTPIPIPDNNPSGAASVISVTDPNTVIDVDVRVRITHTYDGDLSLVLTAPTGVPITLSDRRGGSGDDYLDTLFDDDAATPIANGSAPFAGSFRPDEALAGAEGIVAEGDWKLEAIDQAGLDVGTIQSWSLILTYPAQACGPHARFVSGTLEIDSCASGGEGNDNDLWEGGEQVEFSVLIENDGSEPLTGLGARVTPITAGVVMLDDFAAVGDLGPGESGPSVPPHFIALLPDGLTCGQDLDFRVDIEATEGAWFESFRPIVGEIVPGGGVALAEDFESGLPAAWTVVDGFGDGNTWFADDASDPAGCANTDPDPPVAGSWAAADSDCAETGVTMDEELVSPVLDLSLALTATVEFDHWFRWYSGGLDEKGDVDVRSSLTGGAWINVRRFSGGSTENPAHEAIDITGEAAGATDVEIRWRYHDASFEWNWFVDNVTVSFTRESSCNETACAPSPAGPPPVPELRADPDTPDGSRILVQWDDLCSPASTKILYGPLDEVASYTISGSVCGIANPGVWDPVPAEDLWFVVVGDDALGAESSWGRSTAGERNGLAPSDTCGSTVKDLSASCP